MKFASFTTPAGKASYGLVTGSDVLDLGATRPDAPTLKAFLASGEAVSDSTAGPRYALSALKLLPVITNPDKILCVGVNYEEHRKETGRDPVGHPTLFVRFTNTLVAHEAPMIRPSVSTQFDYEGELALIIGKAGRHITKADAYGHIAGYACFNDGTMRDFQRHTHQFTPGKNFVGSGGFGPFLVTSDEVGALPDLHLRTRLNGELVQEATLGEMIFDIPSIIAYISSFTRLEVGDVIVTGTPGGVGAKRVPPLWMKAGDVVEVDIERVGTLRNSIADEL